MGITFVTSPAKVPRPPMLLVWLTRDSDPDGVYPFVDVWCVEPIGSRDDNGRYWVTLDTSDRIGRYSISDAMRRFRTIPDDDRQCVRCYTEGV